MNGPGPMMLPPRNHTLSPVSTTGSEWSGINNYDNFNNRGPDSPYSPTIPFNRGDLVTPPSSGSGNGPPPMNGMNGPNGGLPPRGPPGRRPSQPAPSEPSPPTSMVGSRASDGTLSDQQSKKYRKMEESLAQHYNVLRRYLNGGSQPQLPRPNKARDKLLRLSAVQFHELSTDVYDELRRRQAATPPPPGPNGQRPPPPRNVPPHLMPRPDYHEKRNQARSKLSSLQQQRFRDLATDVFCELERRFPRFAGADVPRKSSPSQSMRGPPSRGQSTYSNGGYGPGPVPPYGGPGGPGPNGFGPPPPRSQSRGPPPMGPGPYMQPYGPEPTLPSIDDLADDPNAQSDYGRPLPRQFQSNTIIPTKSTMVEDEDDVSAIEDQYERRSDAFGLDGPAGSRSSNRDTSMTSRSGNSSNRDGKLLAEAQTQLAELKDQVEDLESSVRRKDMEIVKLQEAEKKLSVNSEELSSVKADLEGEIESLRKELSQAKMQTGDGAWKSKFDDLDQEHQSLRSELEEQRKVTEEVRKDAAMFLSEMRSMAENGDSNWEREEKLTRENHRLEEEVKEWKGRYAKTKAQLRQVRATSMGLSIQRPDAGRVAKDNEFTQPDGLVKDVHVTKFQISIDELLRIARSDDPTAVLNHMKAVVLAVRNITQDVDSSSDNKNDEMVQRRAKLKSKVSITANNVITASKNFAASGGLSPVSLLDAAASHLTSAVVELVRTVKIKPTPAGELEDDDEPSLEALQSPGYFSVTHSRRLSGNESVYSAISSPPVGAIRNGKESLLSTHRRSASKASAVSNGFSPGPGAVKLGFGMRAQDSELEELKLYLEDQTDILIKTIQALVNSIRADDDLRTIRGHMNNLANVVGKVVSATETSMREPNASPALQQKAEPIVRSLAECENQLLDACAESEGIQDEVELKEFTNRLPPLAFEIARETKELVQRLDTIDIGEEEDDFN